MNVCDEYYVVFCCKTTQNVSMRYQQDQEELSPDWCCTLSGKNNQTNQRSVKAPSSVCICPVIDLEMFLQCSRDQRLGCGNTSTTPSWNHFIQYFQQQSAFCHDSTSRGSSRCTPRVKWYLVFFCYRMLFCPVLTNCCCLFFIRLFLNKQIWTLPVYEEVELKFLISQPESEKRH